MDSRYDYLNRERSRATGRLVGTVTGILWAVDSQREYPATVTEEDLASLRTALMEYETANEAFATELFGSPLLPSPIQQMLS